MRRIVVFLLVLVFALVHSEDSFGYDNDISNGEDAPMSYDEMLQVWEGVQGLLAKYVEEGNRKKISRMVSGSFWMVFNRNYASNHKKFLGILSRPESEEWFQVAPSRLVYQESQEAIVVEMVNSKGTTWQLWLKPNNGVPGYWSIVMGTSTKVGNVVPEIPN